MPAAPEGIPWLAWAIVVVVLALIAQVPLLVQQHRTKKDLGEVKEQVKNTHTRNLREDIDEAKGSASDAHTEAQLAKEASHRTERLVKDMLLTLRAVEHAIDRRDQLHADAMEELRDDQGKTSADLLKHIDEVPATVAKALEQVPPMIEAALATHLDGCPARPARQQRKS